MSHRHNYIIIQLTLVNVLEHGRGRGGNSWLRWKFNDSEVVLKLGIPFQICKWFKQFKQISCARIEGEKNSKKIEAKHK